ncbi:MAG: ATP-binding protein [Clostridia bacterium]|nr:ATP-binding protein [Clostridia bacterium]
MGNYLNPGKGKFKQALNTKTYVDKSGLIRYTNGVLNTLDKYLCVSRPRRFGKTVTADMLTAYYGRGCDSHTLFDGLDISKSPDYETHINKYDVVYLDAASFFDVLHREEGFTISQSLIRFIELLTGEIMDEYPNIPRGKGPFIDYLSDVSMSAGTSFVFVIDEWDAVFRENEDDKKGQEDYLKFLRDLLKGQEYVALAYMTGILPIKRYSSESALNMFDEYTMLDSGDIKEYIGFTENDVEKLCAGTKFTKQNIKDWYDGYTLDGLEIYNPKSVTSALKKGKLSNYWTGTGAFESLLSYIKVNVEGLHDVILKLLAKEEYVLESYDSFENDLSSLKGKNDYLVALIHLGYLSYDSRDRTIKIPNHEVRMRFVDSLGSMKESIVAKFYDYSSRLLDATTKSDAKGVAEMLGRIFAELTKRCSYPYENAFGDFVDFAYMCANDYYDVIPEAPTRWLKKADFVLYPNLLRARGDRSYLPGIIIELKNEKSAEEAADQIEEKGYDDYFEYRKYHGDVIHVGLDFRKMTLKEKKALAEKDAVAADTEDGMNVGNDAGLDTQAEIVHFSEIRVYRI